MRYVFKEIHNGKTRFCYGTSAPGFVVRDDIMGLAQNIPPEVLPKDLEEEVRIGDKIYRALDKGERKTFDVLRRELNGPFNKDEPLRSGETRKKRPEPVRAVKERGGVIIDSLGSLVVVVDSLEVKVTDKALLRYFEGESESARNPAMLELLSDTIKSDFSQELKFTGGYLRAEENDYRIASMTVSDVVMNFLSKTYPKEHPSISGRQKLNPLRYELTIKGVLMVYDESAINSFVVASGRGHFDAEAKRLLRISALNDMLGGVKFSRGHLMMYKLSTELFQGSHDVYTLSELVVEAISPHLL